MMSREQLRQLSGAYVLNALDDEERRAFEECLLDWDDMRSEVTELADTAAALALALPPVEPAPAVKESVLERIAGTPQSAVRTARDVVPRRRAVTRVARPESKPREAARKPPLFALVAALATVLVLIAVATSLVPGRSDGEVTLAQVKEAPDAQRVPVPLPGGDGVELIWSEDLGASALEWESLPPLEGDRVYELWYVNGSARPAGLVTDESAGGRVLEGTMRRGDRVGITIEPEGGSPAPTTAPLVLVDIT